MPGIDPADIQRAVRAGLLHAERKGIAQAQLFRDREGGNVTDLRVTIGLGAGSGDHTGQVLHIFHGAEQVAEVLVVGLVTTDVDEVRVGELFRYSTGRVHVTEG